MLKFFHLFFHIWENFPYSRHPIRKDWFCVLRRCRICERVEYNSFGTFGDKKWYELKDASGCQPWEHKEIKESAIYEGLLKENVTQND